MEIVTLPNGHLVLPEELRRRLGIGQGSRFEINVEDHKGIIILRPISSEYYPVVYRGERSKVASRMNSHHRKAKTK
jgi:AbrB family looped-hinge helix DNA binding protein